MFNVSDCCRQCVIKAVYYKTESMHSVFKKEKNHDANCIASVNDRIISENSRNIRSNLTNLLQINHYIADINHSI